MVMGDPGIEAVRRSAHYPSVLWTGRLAALALVVFLTALFFINTKVGLAIMLVAFLFFVASYVAMMLAISKVCAEHPGSIERFVRSSALAGKQMDLFRRKPPMARR